MFNFFGGSKDNVKAESQLIVPEDILTFAEKLASDLGEVQSMPIPGQEGWFVMDNATAQEAEEKGAKIFNLQDMIHCVVYAGKDITDKVGETAQDME
jgi:hypothetical protein